MATSFAPSPIASMRLLMLLREFWTLRSTVLGSSSHLAIGCLFWPLCGPCFSCAQHYTVSVSAHPRLEHMILCWLHGAGMKGQPVPRASAPKGKVELKGLTVPLSWATWKRFIMRTMVAFWEGDARQTTTPLHMLASSASSGSKSVPRMRLSVRPSTTISGEWPCTAGCQVSIVIGAARGIKFRQDACAGAMQRASTHQTCGLVVGISTSIPEKTL